MMLEHGVVICSNSKHRKLAITPCKINMEPENHGLVQMIFLFSGGPYSHVNHVNLPGCNSPS